MTEKKKNVEQIWKNRGHRRSSRTRVVPGRSSTEVRGKIRQQIKIFLAPALPPAEKEKKPTHHPKTALASQQVHSPPVYRPRAALASAPHRRAAYYEPAGGAKSKKKKTSPRGSSRDGAASRKKVDLSRKVGFKLRGLEIKLGKEWS